MQDIDTRELEEPMMEGMKRLVMGVTKPLFKLIGQRKMKRFVIMIADLAEVDLVPAAYEQMGIVQYDEDFRNTGEAYVVENLLAGRLNGERPVLFDVGANVGAYAGILSERFPNAEVHAFEPNEAVYNVLRERAPERVHCWNLGLGDKRGSETIYFSPKSGPGEHLSELGSVYRDVFPEMHEMKETLAAAIEMDTLDDFCARENIDKIDFLKIDTEGHEMAVLMGGRRMLSENRVGIIQFEFTGVNVFSRVFLRDFYALLKQYDIHRLHPKGPIPLPDYNLKNEVFVYQNFLAILRSNKS